MASIVNDRMPDFENAEEILSEIFEETQWFTSLSLADISKLTHEQRTRFKTYLQKYCVKQLHAGLSGMTVVQQEGQAETHTNAEQSDKPVKQQELPEFALPKSEHFQLNCDESFQPTDQVKYKQILQCQTTRLTEWFRTPQGVYRSVNPLAFNGIAGLVAFSRTPTSLMEQSQGTAKFRLVMRVYDENDLSKSNKPENWIMHNLHEGWTDPESGVLDFSGRLVPGPKVDDNLSCAATHEQRIKEKLAHRAKFQAEGSTLPDGTGLGLQIIPLEDMKHTIDFTRLDGVHVECSQDPGDTTVILFCWNMLVTIGELRAPYFSY